MVEERLLDFFLALNIFYVLTFLALLFRYRPWRWVAVAKIAGFGLVLLFQFTATVVWLIFGLPLADILAYALWCLIFGWTSIKLAREGVIQLLVIATPDAKHWSEFRLKARRDGPRTLIVEAVPKEAVDKDSAKV